MSNPRFLGFHANPRRWGIPLTALPFVLLFAAYAAGSYMRLQSNPADKLMPSFGSILEGLYSVTMVHDRRTGDILLLTDWIASMLRLLVGVGGAAGVALLVGLNAGAYPGFRKLVMPFVTFISIIPPMALLPILFVTFGTDETGKVMLIFLGLVWTITRDTESYVRALPVEQYIKGLTLGGTSNRILYRIILPQVWPRVVDSMRMSMGAAWLFLIASEAIAAQSGLGYRIFLVRRYLAMDIILPYVAAVTLTGFALDYGLRFLNRRFFPWYVALNGEE